MSHFVVVVIGDDPEGQLEPFDEQKSVAPYRDYLDTSPRERGGENIPAYEMSWAARREHLEAFCKEKGISEEEFYQDTIKPEEGSYTTEPGPIQQEFNELHESYEPTFDLLNPSKEDLITVAAALSDEDDQYGVDEEGLYRLSTYNPQSKWDWYQVGGRWRGFFPVKPDAEHAALGTASWTNEDADADENVADVALKKDVDFERARDEARKAAEEAFDKYWSVVKDYPDLKGWSHFRAQAEEGRDIEEVRNEYHAQPGRIALKESEDGFFFGCPIDAFGTDRDAYVQSCVNNALVPYAILHNGEWYQKSEMGWWGISYDEKMTQEEWNEQIQKLYDSLDDDTLLTAVDCHI